MKTTPNNSVGNTTYSLSNIIIPKKLKKIGIGAFQNIGNLIYDGDLDTGNITIK